MLEQSSAQVELEPHLEGLLARSHHCSVAVAALAAARLVARPEMQQELE